jgi:hypothetical protein
VQDSKLKTKENNLILCFFFYRGSSRIKEMYDIEMAEAKKLIDDTKSLAAAANVKTQQAEQELKRQQARYNEVSGLRETDRKELDALQRKIAENDAVRFKFKIILGNSSSSNDFF